MAKTQYPSVLDDIFNGFSVPSHYDFVEGDLDELVLCPVRAVRLYLKRTKQFRPGCNHLFISTDWNKVVVSTGQNKVVVSKNTFLLLGF